MPQAASARTESQHWRGGRRSKLVWPAVLLGHAALLVLWLLHPVPADRGPLQPALQVLLLREVRPADPPAAAAPTTAAALRRRPAPAETRAITLPALQVPLAAALPVPAAPATAASAAPAPPPLNAVLPRGAASAPTARSQALNDPRANAPKPTVESIVGRLTENDVPRREVLADGSVRYFGKGGCVRVAPSRQSQIDPFNPAVKLIPAQVGSC